MRVRNVPRRAREVEVCCSPEFSTFLAKPSPRFSFSFRHLHIFTVANNEQYQMSVSPSVAKLACNAEPNLCAGLALLNLADNFANHLKIAIHAVTAVVSAGILC